MYFKFSGHLCSNSSLNAVEKSTYTGVDAWWARFKEAAANGSTNGFGLELEDSNKRDNMPVLPGFVRSSAPIYIS